jgi:hypothetical protein
MDVRPRRAARLGLTACLLLCLASAAAADAVPAGRLLPLAVHDGCCQCVLPTPAPDAKYFVILGCLTRGTGPYRVSVRTEGCSDPVSLPLDEPCADQVWAHRIHDLHARLARARRDTPPSSAYPPAADPPRRRTFYLFTQDHDFQDPAGYTGVVGELQAVGRHCLVYLDHDHPDPAAERPLVSDVIRTFDEEVYPRACRTFGRALDVDRDGRFAILLTGWVGKLQRGRVSVGGFVRGSDFYRDLAAPFGNRCDMMYLNAGLRPGPHLHTLLAHEYTHAVVFSEHVFGCYLPEASQQDEEGWLNEGLAHLAEDLSGYSWSNLDYRISAFLSAPSRYQLVVPDYYGAGLWRNPGNRGATYLFLRWCTDQNGADLPRQLVQTNLSGVANLEAATQERFPDLFRHWSAALLLQGSGLTGDADPNLSTLDLRRPLAGRLLCGPCFTEVALAGASQDIDLTGTSTAYLLLHSPASDCARVTVTAEPGTELQVSLVRVPAGTARLSLRQVPGQRPGTVRLLLTACDAGVTLNGAAWERLCPGANRPEDTSYRPDEAAGTVRSWFGDAVLKQGETRASIPITLPDGTDPLMLKVGATDAAGHRLAAWLSLDGRKTAAESQPASTEP